MGKVLAVGKIKNFFLVVQHRQRFRFLALKTALTAEADYLFMPEYPPPDNWPEVLYEKVIEVRWIYIGTST